MQVKQKLIQQLEVVKENDYQLNKDQSIQELLEAMLSHIGDSNAYLRDQLILRTFIHWIEFKRMLTNEQIGDLINRLLSDDYAFYMIEQDDDLSALRRSFSILVLDPILCLHQETNNLTTEQLSKISSGLLRFVDQEVNYTGYHQQYGWVHSLGHAFDALNQLLNCPGAQKSYCNELLRVLKKKILDGDMPLSAEEDERIVNLLYYDMIEEKLISTTELSDWLLSLLEVTSIEDKAKRFNARFNIKNIIRSLYFRMIHYKNYDDLKETALKVEKALNLYTIE